MTEWRALKDAKKARKVKSIGVSNFLINDLKNILKHGTVKPVVNQILTHIGNTPFNLIEFCQKEDIILEAYSPIAHGQALQNPTIIEMAEKYQVSTAQLCIKYVMQLGMVALPKSTNPNHMLTNMKLDFTVDSKDMTILKAINVTDYGEDTKFPVFSGK